MPLSILGAVPALTPVYTPRIQSAAGNLSPTLKSSTGFGALVDFINKAHKAGKEVKLCKLDSAVRLGADIIGVGKFVEIFDTQHEAVKAFEKV